MAISGVSSLVSSSVGASAVAAAQGENAQKNPLAGLLQRDDASAQTQLSFLGRTKLSLEDIQASAQAARNVNNPPTISDFKVAVQGVVQSLNALASVARQAAADTAARPSALTDNRPSQAFNQVRNALQDSDGNAARSLQRLGVSQTPEGTFAVNQRQLEASFQEDRQGILSALFDVADRVDAAAERALTGAPPAREETETETPENTDRPTPDEEAETRAAQRESFRELLAAQLANAGGYVARNAVATYFSVAAL